MDNGRWKGTISYAFTRESGVRYFEVNEKSENAYNDIWSALARRLGMLDGLRDLMRRFDARRQNENETLVEYEQALRM